MALTFEQCQNITSACGLDGAAAQSLFDAINSQGSAPEPVVQSIDTTGTTAMDPDADVIVINAISVTMDIDEPGSVDGKEVKVICFVSNPTLTGDYCGSVPPITVTGDGVSDAGYPVFSLFWLESEAKWVPSVQAVLIAA